MPPNRMNRAYYYFAASLPMLLWGGKVPLSMEDYLSDCQRLLEENDYALVRRLLEGEGGTGATGNAAADAWLRFDRNFRNEMALFRAQRLGKDPAKHVRGDWDSDPSLKDVIHQASKSSNLMSAETLLDQTVWQFLDELVSGHYYDTVYIFVYGLKLKILERHRQYHSPQGRSSFDEIRMIEFPESCILESRLK